MEIPRFQGSGLEPTLRKITRSRAESRSCRQVRNFLQANASWQLTRRHWRLGRRALLGLPAAHAWRDDGLRDGLRLARIGV